MCTIKTSIPFGSHYLTALYVFSVYLTGCCNTHMFKVLTFHECTHSDAAYAKTCLESFSVIRGHLTECIFSSAFVSKIGA
jgi:hypothetical protein